MRRVAFSARTASGLFPVETPLLCTEVHSHGVSNDVFQNPSKPRQEFEFVRTTKVRQVTVRFEARLLNKIRRVKSRIHDTVQMSPRENAQVRPIVPQQRSERFAIPVASLGQQFNSLLAVHSPPNYQGRKRGLSLALISREISSSIVATPLVGDSRLRVKYLPTTMKTILSQNCEFRPNTETTRLSKCHKEARYSTKEASQRDRPRVS